MAAGSRPQPGAITLPPIALDTDLDCETPEVREGLAYWQSKAAGREMPLRADIRPEEIPRLLPFISLFEIRRQSGFLEIFPRIAGSRFEDVFGPIHNRPLSTVVAPEIRERWLGATRTMMEARQPLLGRGEVLHEDKTFIRFEILLAPLSRTGEELDMIFLVSQFTMKGDIRA